MTDTRKTMQQALELCERIRDAREVWSMEESRSVCLNLRSALAQQGEPVAWKHSCNALCVDELELFIDSCPHCGKPRSAGAEPATQPDARNVIEQLAREAGFKSPDFYKLTVSHTSIETLERFYTLARADLEAEIEKLHTTMLAAAVEIQFHWKHHCDAEGYGPANLMHRLERGINGQYGYDAKTLVRMDKRIASLEAEVEQLHVQLAGCGVAAMQNTVYSRSQRVVRGDYGYSESYAEVCRAVDSEIELRAENAKLLDALDTAITVIEEYQAASIRQGFLSPEIKKLREARGRNDSIRI